jgi:putative addiction module CopG family antidote
LPNDFHAYSELQVLVEKEMASGRYSSTDEVLKQALQMLCEHHRREELLRELDKGLADSQAGRTMLLDENAVERMKAKGRALRQEKQTQ